MAIRIKLHFIALFALGTMICFTESCTKVTDKPCCGHAGWWTGKRCVKWCTKTVWECPHECRHVTGKRSDLQLGNNTEGFSCKFEAYDLDNNFKITDEEFFKSQKLDPKENQHVFKSADINGDGELTCEELSDASFRFKCEVVCSATENDFEDEVEDQITELINS